MREGSAVLLTNMNLLPLIWLNSKLRSSLQAIGPPTLPAQMRVLAKHYIRPHKDAVSLARALRRFLPAEFVGMHIRTCPDHQPNCCLHRAKNVSAFLNCAPNKTVFLATPSERLKRRLIGRVVTRHNLAGLSPNRTTDGGETFNAVVDLLLLSAASVLVTSEGSTFSELAMALSRARTFVVPWDGAVCEARPLAFYFCLRTVIYQCGSISISCS